MNQEKVEAVVTQILIIIVAVLFVTCKILEWKKN